MQSDPQYCYHHLHEMHFDEILSQHLGEMGTFQKTILGILCIHEAFVTTLFLGPVFTAAIPEYW